MKDWKEVPHLFANNEFRVFYSKSTKPDYAFKIWGTRYSKQILIDPSINRFVHVDNCQLIARPISDITDEEMQASPLPKWLNGYDKKMFLEVCAKNNPNRMNSEQMLYLLSIGCYPFDQSHFGKTVININEVEND